ncbi:uncharacterized protein LOC135931651 isoform X3 [Gordionus sp. m RMFG-2023]|uniref:uncharacterized protein LOC135931651 isoform X3 n=1 Tax=Gordionus sp. m RMFG-2023 TaxID=3053472 RepID=UPI0031FE2061
MSIYDIFNKYIYEIDQILIKNKSLEYIYEKIKDELKIYHENPILLKPYIENFIIKLIGSFDKSRSNNLYLKKILYNLSSIVGPKSFSTYLPHDIQYLPILVDNLTQYDLEWEDVYINILWLAIVCKNPFNLSLIKSKQKFSNQHVGQSTVELTHKITLICQYMVGSSVVRISKTGDRTYLLDGSLASRASAYLAGQYLSRPEIFQKELAGFLSWAVHNIHALSLVTMENIYTVRSILLALSYTFKYGGRDDMLPYAKDMLEKCLHLNHIVSSDQVIIRKTYLKLLQRLAIIILNPNLAIERHHRINNQQILHIKGKRKDRDNSQLVQIDDVNPNINEKEPFSKENLVRDNDQIPKAIDVSFNIIQETLEHLITGLSDVDMDVNYTAAKGIARISLQLPDEYLEHLMKIVIKLFGDNATLNHCHGGCLCVAEMARQKLLQSQFILQIIPCLIKALFYEKRMGTTVVGEKVRDAACYALWSFARTYPSNQMKQHLKSIVENLLFVALFDSDKKCRRAASATFQEYVGRYGENCIPAGIEILTKVDFCDVCNLRRCYISLAPFIVSLKTSFPSACDYIGIADDQSVLPTLHEYPYFEPLLNFVISNRLLGFCNLESKVLAGLCVEYMLTRIINAFYDDEYIGFKGIDKEVVGDSLLKDPTCKDIQNLIRYFCQESLKYFQLSRGQNENSDSFSRYGALIGLGHILKGTFNGYIKIIKRIFNSLNRSKYSIHDKSLNVIERNDSINYDKFNENNWTHILVSQQNISMIRQLIHAEANVKEVNRDKNFDYGTLNNGQILRLSALCSLICNMCDSEDLMFCLLREDQVNLDYSLLFSILNNVVDPAIFYPQDIVKTIDPYFNQNGLSSLKALGELLIKRLDNIDPQITESMEIKNFARENMKNHYMKILRCTMNPAPEGVAEDNLLISSCKALPNIPIQLLCLPDKDISDKSDILNNSQDLYDITLIYDVFTHLNSSGRFSCQLRKESLIAYTKIVVSYLDNVKITDTSRSTFDTAKLMQCLVISLSDRTLDPSYGDIGRVVRSAGVDCAGTFLLHFASFDTNFMVASAMAAQSCSSCDKLRLNACTALSAVAALYCRQNENEKNDENANIKEMLPPMLEITRISYFWNSLSHIYSQDINWLSVYQAFPALMPLLNIPECRENALLELLFSFGSTVSFTSESSISALRNYLKNSNSYQIQAFSQTINLIYKSRSLNPSSSRWLQFFILNWLRAVDAILNLKMIVYNQTYIKQKLCVHYIAEDSSIINIRDLHRYHLHGPARLGIFFKNFLPPGLDI